MEKDYYHALPIANIKNLERLVNKVDWVVE